MIRKLEGVLDDMCSVIEYYERKAMVEGLAEGEVKNATANVRSLMSNLGIDVEKAMDILEIDEELKHRIYVRLGEELE